MHPITYQFINTGDRLGEIIENNYDKNQFLELVFYRVTQTPYTSINVDVALITEIDKAIVFGHKDLEVYFLFICFALNFTSRLNHLSSARTIRTIGMSFNIDLFHPVLQSYYFLSISSLAIMENNVIESEKLLKMSLSRIEKNNPRYHVILINVASILSNFGKLNELSSEDLKLLNSPKTEQHALISIHAKLNNDIFLCDYISGFKTFEELKSKFDLNSLDIFNGADEILKIQSGNFNEKDCQIPYYKHFANICNFMVLGNYDMAIHSYQLLKQCEMDIKKILFSIDFELNFALILKNKGKARYIYQEMEKTGGLHYLDDLYLARLHLLEMNKLEARYVFNRLLKNVNRYGAINRLEFELQFAKELSINDMLFLMNNELKKSEVSVKVNQSVPYVHRAKGVKLLIGESDKINSIKKLVKKFASIAEPVLILGETGTGKELVARAIHEEGSNSKEPFLAINCSSLTDSLLQSELFGYEAGAFTGAIKEHKGIFESAGTGTVFLDEFGDISPKLQASLLRVLESNEILLIGGTRNRQIKCKVIVATNVDLEKVVEQKKFREDLYFRLARFVIKIPPLRERIEDIPILINYFLKSSTNNTNSNLKLSTELIEALVKYRWPGNVRELKNEIDRIKILYPDIDKLSLEDFDMAHLWGVKSKIEKPERELVIAEKPTNNFISNSNISNDKISQIIHKGSKTDQRHEFIKELFKQYQKLTRRQIMEILSISAGTATNDLKILCDNGVIKRVKPSKSQKSDYFIFVPNI